MKEESLASDRITYQFSVLVENFMHYTSHLGHLQMNATGTVNTAGVVPISGGLFGGFGQYHPHMWEVSRSIFQDKNDHLR